MDTLDEFKELADRLLWRPMETAPLDGTPVLVSCEGDVHEAKFHPEADGWWLANCDPTDYWDGQIWPEAWKPMPDPPSKIDQ